MPAYGRRARRRPSNERSIWAAIAAGHQLELARARSSSRSTQAKRSAIAPSELRYVFVAATASSSPASSGSTASAAVPIGEPGRFVIAIVGRPWRRASLDHRAHVGRLARLRDADHERAVEPRRLLVERVERRRRERDRHAVRAAEQVLRVARGVRRAAARGDQEVADVRPAEERAELAARCAACRSSSRASASGCSRSSCSSRDRSRGHLARLEQALGDAPRSSTRLPPYVAT